MQHHHQSLTGGLIFIALFFTVFIVVPLIVCHFNPVSPQEES